MPKRVLQGTVVSNKAQKTITISVERLVNHPLYRKVIRKHKKYMAHDPNDSYKIGDIVKIKECIPYSKNKKWEVIEVVK